MHIFTLTSIFVALASQTKAAVYSLSDDVVGYEFYNAFGFQSFPDPTHGRVEYVDQATARANNLTYATSDTFILRADHKHVVPASGIGRQSVRLQSYGLYTTHLLVLDVRHMPQGCATWPAIWETGLSNWPYMGEVDIVEGVNDQTPNRMTLHTAPGCTMPNFGRFQTGYSTSTDCDAFVNSNAGCSVSDPNFDSYGLPFNSNGGGWWAMERTGTYIRVWFWPRNGNPPPEVRYGGPSVDTSTWGMPNADFPNTQCNLNKAFSANAIVINLTLCGDWAGSLFNRNGCLGNCNSYVDNNPGAFSNAYFDFAALRVYE